MCRSWTQNELQLMKRLNQQYEDIKAREKEERKKRLAGVLEAKL